MPTLSSAQIESLKTSVREAIIEANPGRALVLLGEALPAGRVKYNQIVVLRSRQAEIIQHTVNNTINEEQLDVLRNNLTADILLFTDCLTTPDFQPEPSHRPGLKPGHLLYQVPNSMVLQKNYECLVRVAEELSQVLEGIVETEDVVTEDIGLSEVMEVEILDPGGPGNPAFNIMVLSDGEQVVDAYSYTEWVFNVRPLQEGQHQLILKISVLLTVKGKERTKNVILRRPINVAAKATVDALPAKLQRVVTLAVKEETISLPEETIDAGPPDRLSPPKMEPAESAGVQEEPADSGSPEPPLPPVMAPNTVGTKGGTPVPRIPTPSIQPEKRRNSTRGSSFSLVATLLLLVFAGVWLVRSDGFENLLPGEKSDVGTTDPDTLKTSPASIDSLTAPKSLLPDSLKND